MKYTWDLKSLNKERLSLLKELILNPKISKNEGKAIKTDYLIIDNILKDMNTSCFDIELPQTYLDKNNMLPKYYFNDFSKMNFHLISIIFNLIPLFDTLLPQDLSLYKMNISTKEIIEVTRDFFQNLPHKKYYQDIEKYLNPNNHLLQIDSTHQISYYTGYTVSLSYPNRHSYVIVYKENTIIDLFTLIHELSHVYFYKYIDSYNLSTPYYYIMEIEGKLFDYLTEKYLIEKEYPKGEIDKIKSISLEDQLETITSLYLGKTVVDLYKKRKSISREIIKDKIDSEFPNLMYSYDSLEDILTYSPRDNLKEIISYLAFLDLKQIADKDIEKALYLLENIKKDTNPNILKTLAKNEITFMKDGYQNFQKEIELVKQYKQ